MRHYVLTLLIFSSLNTFAQGSLESDRLALVTLYNSAGGSGWFNKTGWLVPGSPGDSPCGWYGVTCEGGRVTGLDLDICGLNGNIPPEIGSLDQLKTLTLGWNLVAGEGLNDVPIPTEIGNLINLEHLDLSGNTGRDYGWESGGMPFRGPIPPSLGNLTKLTYLDLSYLPEDAGFDPFGFISGSIPPELGNLVNLTYLNISNQSLTGDLPAELGNLTKLKTLSLGANDFSGVIPTSFNNFSEIQLLDLRFWAHLRKHEFGLLHGAVPNLSGLPLSAKVYLDGNSFTFAGMETNISRLTSYSYQARLPMFGYFPLSSSSGPGGMLYVEAGGTLTNNTYKWYKDGVLVAANIGNENFNAYELGTYRVEVTNGIATELTLISDDYTVSSLPVTLISFSGESNLQGNELSWKTTSETSNSGFEIEKSADAKSFEKIGFIDGNGDSKESNTYSFTDSYPLSTTYYRLKQLDYDGKYEYSRVISVKSKSEIVRIYPNPANEQFYVKGLNQKENVVVRNLQGKLVLTKNVSPAEPVNTRNLSNGLYMITVGNETHKMVIQK